MTRSVFLQGPSFSVGVPRSLDVLQELEGISDDILADFTYRGLSVFCEARKEIVDMCMDAVLGTLAKAGVAAADIDGVVFINDTPDLDKAKDASLPGFLRNLGIRTDTLRVLQVLHCSGFAAGLSAAADLIQQCGKSKILIVLCGRIPSGYQRLQQKLGIVYGDGASACILSTRSWGFRLVAAETYADPELEASSDEIDSTVNKLRAFQNLRSVSRGVIEKASIETDNISHLFGTHGSDFYLKIIAGAIGLSSQKLFDEPMKTYGHVSSCDNLISLAIGEERGRLNTGEYILTIGWSPHMVGAAVLKVTGPQAVPPSHTSHSQNSVENSPMFILSGRKEVANKHD